jgi:hypothetical protein
MQWVVSLLKHFIPPPSYKDYKMVKRQQKLKKSQESTGSNNTNANLHQVLYSTSDLHACVNIMHGALMGLGSSTQPAPGLQSMSNVYDLLHKLLTSTYHKQDKFIRNNLPLAQYCFYRHVHLVIEVS